mmetsp:Transcript_42698/g.123411  ORF Transcript_42698/g.123411 Transcript_42698/m.123411 type:complete len:262 (-) Transcript_42698:1695-2480(-)
MDSPLHLRCQQIDLPRGVGSQIRSVHERCLEARKSEQSANDPLGDRLLGIRGQEILKRGALAQDRKHNINRPSTFDAPPIVPLHLHRLADGQGLPRCVQLVQLAQERDILCAWKHLVIDMERLLVRGFRLAVSEEVGKLAGQFFACRRVSGNVAVVDRCVKRIGPIDQAHGPVRAPLQHGEQASVLQVPAIANHETHGVLRSRVLHRRHGPHIHLRVDMAADARDVGHLRAKRRGAHADGAREAEGPRRRVQFHGLAAHLV